MIFNTKLAIDAKEYAGNKKEQKKSLKEPKVSRKERVGSFKEHMGSRKERMGSFKEHKGGRKEWPGTAKWRETSGEMPEIIRLPAEEASKSYR